MTSSTREQNLQFTAQLYGQGQFRRSVDNLNLPEGFVKYHKENFAKYLGLSEEDLVGKKVCETGCGPGKHAAVLALMGADVTAIDLSEDNIRKGEQLQKHYDFKNIKFIQHNLMLPLFKPGFFDVITSNFWIQHSENPYAVLQNLVTTLKKDGRLYISTYHAGTFRFFITQIARSILKREDYEVARLLCRYVFPNAFKEFNNRGDIYFENIFDDFFVPYCHWMTYDSLIEAAESMGLAPVASKPQLSDLKGLDNLYLEMGFKKIRDVNFSKIPPHFEAYDHFAGQNEEYMKRSVKLAREVIESFKKTDNAHFRSAFALGLYRVRAETSKMSDAEAKHLKLQFYLQSCLDDTFKSLSFIYDTETLYKGNHG